MLARLRRRADFSMKWAWAVFWLSTGGVAGTYLLYPAVLWMLSRTRSPEPRRGRAGSPAEPLLSIIVAAHNEAAVIGPAIGKCSQLMGVFLVTLYCRRLAGYIFFATSMLYAWAAWYNVWGHEMYEPILMSILPL